MKFEVGETVVYPHHGAAEIIEVSEKKIRGVKQKYLKLKVAQGDLIIQVPAANVEMVGVRDVIDKKGVKQVFDVLRAEFVEEPTNWSRRYKANLEKLASGDVVKVSEVAFQPVKSACSPRPVKYLFPSWPLPEKWMRKKPQPSSTRYWPASSCQLRWY
jgi:RNA polymerase-interacting CarD/CdnL/TRCF family regulator